MSLFTHVFRMSRYGTHNNLKLSESQRKIGSSAADEPDAACGVSRCGKVIFSTVANKARGAWCVVRGVWCVVRGAWCVVRASCRVVPVTATQ